MVDRQTRVLLNFLSAALLATTVGCTRTSDLPPRAAVSGLVSLDGQPLTTGTVQFVPESPNNGVRPTATGSIAADGRFTLSTDRQAGGGDGAVLGWHQVRVIAIKPPVKETDPPRSLIPARYGDATKSGLRFEVQPVEQNVIDLVLTSK